MGLVPPSALRAERALSGSVDVGVLLGPAEFHLGAFASSIERAVQVRQRANPFLPLELVNASGPTRAAGVDLLLRLRTGNLTVTSSYTYTSTSEPTPDAPIRRTIPLTPRHAAGTVAAWEREDWGRIGLELYYTGRQELEEDPYRSASRPFAVVGFLVERRLGGIRLFLNAENVTDRRQSRVAPLVRPSQAPDGRWLVDAWGPWDGRAVNAGVRLAISRDRED